jgi:hypothetical protein
VPVEAGNDRLGQIEAVRESPDLGHLGGVLSRTLGTPGVGLAELLEITAGAERPCAGAGQYGDPEVVVLFEAVERSREDDMRVGIEGVEALRTVDPDVGDVAPDLEADRVFGHGAAA